MREKILKTFTARELALSAVFAAAVCVATMVISIPVPATSGFFNVGDSMVFISALLYGAKIGGLAGGVGSAAADILLGYGNYAPFTLIIKGLEGFVVGHISEKNSIVRSVCAVAAGAAVMVTGYFIVQSFMFGIPNALVELPVNLFQVGSGFLIAVPVATAVRKAVPERF